MKLICAYDREKKAKADHKCDICGKLLCSFCGYSKNEVDYCNECWRKKEDNNEIETLKARHDYSMNEDK